jgi:hypothetical protein
MAPTRGKGRLPTHIDTAAAWQQKQQLSQLRDAAAALPDAAALPFKTANEVRRVLLLLQRRGRTRYSASSTSIIIRSSRLLNLGMDSDAALQVASSHISNLIQQMQPCEAAAACVHAHLFAAWVRGVTTAAAAAAAGIAADASSREGTAAQDNSSAGSTLDLVASPTAATAAPGTNDTLGPISDAWTLSSYQYGQLLLLLNAPDMLLDQLAWLQLPGAINMPWRQQQQQQCQEGAAAAAQLSQLQLLLLAEACCAVPALTVLLLLQLLPQQQLPENSSSRSGWKLSAVPAVLLLCLCASAVSPAGGATLTNTADKLLCLRVLYKALQLLLPTAQQQQQLGAEAGLELPEAVLQPIRNATAPAAPAAAHVDEQQQQVCLSGSGVESQQKQHAEAVSSNCWAQHSTAVVHVSCQQLLAGLLQLLQDLLLQWGDTWYSSSSSDGSSSSEGVLLVTRVTVTDLQGQLQCIQQQLQQLLPQYLAAEQAANRQPQQQQHQTDVSGSGDALLQQLLPASLTHQLLVHTNSRLALTLMMMQMQTPGQQQQQQVCGSHTQQAAAAASTSSNAADWAAVCEDPFGRATQQLLGCKAGISSGSEQQRTDKQEPGQVLGEMPGSSNSGVSSRQLSWLSCFTVRQLECVSPGTMYSKPTDVSASNNAAAAQKRLPCSFLRNRHHQTVHQQQAAAITAAPVFTAAAEDSCRLQQQRQQQQRQQRQRQQQLTVQAAVGHLAGLAAAWLTPGYNLGPLLQPPTENNGGDQPSAASTGCATGAGSSTDSAAALLTQVAAAASTSTYGHLRVCCCVVQMLLHAVALQQQQQQVICSIGWHSRCPGLVQLLLAMLAEATQQLEQPELQQALLSAPHHSSTCSDLLPQQHLQRQGASGYTAGCNPWAWLRQQLSSNQFQPSLAAAAAAARGLVAASNKLVEHSDDDGVTGVTTSAAADSASMGGVVAKVVLPQQRQEALLLAELSRVLLLYQMLWPELTVRRLLLDAVQHR